MERQHAKSEKRNLGAGRTLSRTLLVDDHQLFRDGLRALLRSEPDLEICGEAEDEESAVEQFVATNAELVIVDISLASGNGLSVTSRIKALRPSAMVVVLSMFDDRVYAE